MKIFSYPKDRQRIERFFRKAPTADAETVTAVRSIIEQVRRDGDKAVAALTKSIDKADVKPAQFEAPVSKLEAAWKGLDKDLQDALKTAHERLIAFHERQKFDGFSFKDAFGNRMDQRVAPLRRAGVYVPGGQAVYPSTVLMDVVPAKVAKVDEVIMLTPPALLNAPAGQTTLAAAWLAGVDRLFAVGGTPGIAAMAIGTERIPKVDIIVGPGNRFIATAKRLLFGEITIDMVAGPSEILIIADKTAPPELVAADMLSQAEHDADAQAIAVIVGEYDLDSLRAEVRHQTASALRKNTVRASLHKNGAMILVETPEQAIEIAEMKAPEHLEIMTHAPRSIAKEIRNVGAVFIGRNTPEAAGDYVAGPNHTLPTGGTARFFSPLSVWSFLKTSHVVEFTRKGLDGLAIPIIRIAEAEGLDAHAEAVRRRLKR